MIKGETTTGFTFEIDEAVVADWDTLEMFSEMDDEHPFQSIKVAKKLLGLQQYKALRKHCAIPGTFGKVNSEQMFKEINEILNHDVPKN